MAKVDIKGEIISDDDSWIYDWYDIPYSSPKAVSKAISEATAKGEALDVYINSPGGSVSAGAEIYAALREYGNVNIHVIQACSAASVIMCAGHCDITPVGMVMIHNVRMGAQGDNRDMAHASKVLKTADKAIAAAYVEKTGKTEAEMLSYMANETWLTAAEAVEMGLCDEIWTAKADNGGSVTIPALAASAGYAIPAKIIASMRSKRSKAKAELELLRLINNN